ncbi:MAG: hypothetical protein QM767_12950 [Anaeromyxobacter sp.]
MRFAQPQPVSKEAAEARLSSGSTESVAETLVALAFHEPDRAWVQDKCLRFAKDEDWRIRAVAATCLGHLARIHRALDLAVVWPVLLKLQEDADVRPYANDALDDVRMFVGQP